MITKLLNYLTRKISGPNFGDGNKGEVNEKLGLGKLNSPLKVYLTHDDIWINSTICGKQTKHPKHQR